MVEDSLTENATAPENRYMVDEKGKAGTKMDNLEVTVTDDEKLVLVVDLKREVGFTSEGRSVRVATSGGNINLWQNGKLRPEKFNLNVFRGLTTQEKRAGKVFLKRPPEEE